MGSYGRKQLSIRLEGDAGEGVISAGNVLARAAARTGYHVFTHHMYESVVRGGQVTFQLSLGTERVLSPGEKVDVLVALNHQALKNNVRRLSDGATVLCEPGEDRRTLPCDRSAAHVVPLPFRRLAQEADSGKGRNIVAAGAIARLIGLPLDELAGSMEQRFRAQGAAVHEANTNCLHAGYRFVSQWLSEAGRDGRLGPPPRLAPTPPERRMLLSGNEAVALGALCAGVRFFAGYPITPASEILECLAQELPRVGGTMVQAEDEIAALGMCIGASFGGVKSMTATSGPGFSLMAELIGFASMAEIPIVLVDVQRAGPSTGMPTKEGQGDLNFAIHGTHGEAPRVVLALQSVADCFHQTINAVNIAHRFHLPVIVLSSQALSHRTETIDLPDLDRVTVYEEPLYETRNNGQFLRYKLGGPRGATVRSVPGTPGGMYRATGLEHDERGLPAFDAAGRGRMVSRRREKMHAVEAAFQEAEMSLVPEAEVGVIGWGATASLVKELVGRFKTEGIKVSCLCPWILWPMPDRTMRHFLASGIRKLFVCELNATRQFAELLKSRYTPELMAYGIEVVPVNKDTGLPFTTEELWRCIAQGLPTSVGTATE